MNKSFITGRLTANPEAKTTRDGINVTRFCVAVTRRTDREKSDFLNIVAWRGLADICSKYLVKGQKVSIVGEIRTNVYKDQNGNNRYTFDIVADEVEMLDRPSNKSEANNSKAKAKESVEDEFEAEIGDNDLPF